MKHRIVLVDDYEVVRDSLEAFIAMQDDLEVCGSVGTAEAALEVVAARHPDLVVVDISLPGLSGIDLTRHLRTLYPGLRVLVTTGHPDAHHEREALDAGASAFLNKFAGPDALVAAVYAQLQSMGEARA